MSKLFPRALLAKMQHIATTVLARSVTWEAQILWRMDIHCTPAVNPSRMRINQLARAISLMISWKSFAILKKIDSDCQGKQRCFCANTSESLAAAGCGRGSGIKVHCSKPPRLWLFWRRCCKHPGRRVDSWGGGGGVRTPPKICIGGSKK